MQNLTAFCMEFERKKEKAFSLQLYFPTNKRPTTQSCSVSGSCSNTSILKNTFCCEVFEGFLLQKAN